jgi:Asp-tRNA(Asn)/Glu-tRNA(Gln) amidotransferase A subunit family amidase
MKARPQGLIFVGRYPSEPQLLVVGYAYEQASLGQVPPDLETTLNQIEALNE